MERSSSTPSASRNSASNSIRKWKLGSNGWMNSGQTTSRGSMPDQRHVGVLVFDEAEVLDVAGPFEVFSIAGRRSGIQPFNVSLVGIGKGAVTMRGGFMVEPKYTIHTVPHIDVLLIPGGYGTR